MLTTNQKGVLAEAAVTLEAAKLGVGVVLPLGDERYDLILDFAAETAPRSMQVGRSS